MAFNPNEALASVVPTFNAGFMVVALYAAVLIFAIIVVMKKSKGYKVMILHEPAGFSKDRLREKKEGEATYWQLAKCKVKMPPPMYSDIRKAGGFMGSKMVFLSADNEGGLHYALHETDEIIMNEAR